MLYKLLPIARSLKFREIFNRRLLMSTVSQINYSSNLSSTELVEIVDCNNQPIEPKPRQEMRRKNLIHRATYAFIRNSQNYYYVQKRSTLKDYCPNYYDPNPGGVVAAGESYEDTNRREVEEEMGIKNCKMEHLFNFYYEDQNVRCFGDAWDIVYDGPLRLQKEEVESIHLMSLKEIMERFKSGENFTPDSMKACEEYIKIKGYLEPIGPKVEIVLLD